MISVCQESWKTKSMKDKVVVFIRYKGVFEPT